FGLATQAPGAASGHTAAGTREPGARIVYAHRAVLHSVTSSGVPAPPFGRAGGPTAIRGGLGTPVIAASRDGRRIAVLQNTGTQGAHGDYFRVVVLLRGAHKQRQVWSWGPIVEA